MYELTDRVVLITGASGGIGAATARALYEEGARLVLTDVQQASVEQLAAEFDARRVLPLALDVTDLAATRRVVADAVKHFGRLDIAIANAGIAWRDTAATLASCEVEEFEKIVEVDFLGVWRTLKAALPEVVRQQGQLLATSSIYAMLNGMANAPYAASKAGVESMLRSLRAELGSTGASASVIYPGWTDTPIIDIPFGGDAIATRLIDMAMPTALRCPISPDTLAAAIVKGIKKRRPRIVAPMRWQPFFALRGIVNPITDRLLSRHQRIQSLLRQLEGKQEHKVHSLTAARNKRRQANRKQEN